MKLRALPILLLLAVGMAAAQFPPQIKNVVIIFQENRTPDNLFHFLTPKCPIPAGASGLDACVPSPVTDACYDISPCGLSNQKGLPVPVKLLPRAMADPIDPDHTHLGFSNMCDPDAVTGTCQNDGAWRTSSPAGASYSYVTNSAVKNYDGTAGHLLDPYLKLAEQYGWANYMYQSNQGGSYSAHQFMFSGTSAPTAEDDANSTFVVGNVFGTGVASQSGCLAPSNAFVRTIAPKLKTSTKGCVLFADGSTKECPLGNAVLKYPENPVGNFCFPHQTMADVLDARKISWKYYAPAPGSAWTAPDSFKAICEPAWDDPYNDPNSGLKCAGAEWEAHVDTQNLGTDILKDITNCNLAQVTWAIPNGTWSDHPGFNDPYGPSWVAAVVNAIGNQPTCAKGTADAGQNFWENTAIVITWDDWGGWSDNQPAPFLSKLPCVSTDCQGDFQYGFRVPMIVVSAYTPAGYINNNQHDFGSVLRMVEGVNHLLEGQLGFADKRAESDLHGFFTLKQPRKYVTIPAMVNAHFFLTQTGPPIDPDLD